MRLVKAVFFIVRPTLIKRRRITSPVECVKNYFVSQIKRLLIVIFITKNCAPSFHSLANSQNLFYHSKNQDGLAPEAGKFGLPLSYRATQSARLLTYNL